MAKQVLVLGAGMVGSTIAADLASDPGLEVTLADVSPQALARAASKAKLTTRVSDLSNTESLKSLVSGFDLVAGALPSRFGFAALRTVIEAGKPFVDISFMPEDAQELDALAKKHGVTAVVDCGVAPGISNLLSGYASANLDSVDSIDICVGGLPVERSLPFEYKAPFSPSDVIEEYTRPARFRKNGKLVVMEALTEVEPLYFPGIGTLEAFNTDGCRTLLNTLDAPDLRERTLRYPGHAALMSAFRHSGLFSKESVNVGQHTVRPLDVTSALLFPLWKFEEGEADLTVMRIVVEGKKDGKGLRYAWDLLDRYDADTDTRSMSRTTGFPAAIMGRLLLEGRFVKPGVNPPEIIGRDSSIVRTLLLELAKRGVNYTARVESF